MRRVSQNPCRPKPESVQLTQALLRDRSSFFIAAFQNSFRESYEEVFKLPEESAAAFALFVSWIYDTPLSIDAHFNLHTYIEPYSLAQKFCIENLGNHAIDLIKSSFDQSRPMVEPDAVCLAYRITSPGCGLRRFLSGSMAYRFLRRQCDRMAEPVMEDFVQSVVEIEDLARDFIFALNRHRGPGRYWTPCHVKNCFYHDHRQTAPCTTAVASV